MSSAASILRRQFKELTRNPVPGFVVDLKDDNIFIWDVALIGTPKTIYEGGYFKATMTFPEDYPFNPPTFRFNNEFYHPNVYPDGRLCISILHPAGNDPISGEAPE
ncbi:Ubiquitin-conjugating enzyme 13, partial [Rhizopus azygosporus]